MKINYPSITKFQQFVELKDYRLPTRKEYIRYVRKCAEHFLCDPLSLSQDQVRAYFLFLREEKHYTRSPMKAAKYALRSFFLDCHQVQGWTVFEKIRVQQSPMELRLDDSLNAIVATRGRERTRVGPRRARECPARVK